MRMREIILIMIVSVGKAIRGIVGVMRVGFCVAGQGKEKEGRPCFEDFKRHMENLDDEESFKKAAEMMAIIENQELQLKEQIDHLDNELQQQASQNPLGVEIFHRCEEMKSLITAQTSENQEVLVRTEKEIENVRTYGIAKIAWEVLDIADHMGKAIQALQAAKQDRQVKAVRALREEYINVLRTYEIEEFDPSGSHFNPNQQESMGQLVSPSADRQDTVAQVLRTGFRLKDRLLRAAYVVIYQ